MFECNFRIVDGAAASYTEEEHLLKIEINNGGVTVDKPWRAHLEQRLAFALSNFGDRVARVRVRMSQDNRSSVHPLKRCEIELQLRPRSVRVIDTGADPFAAVENAADRLTRSVSRALERERAWAESPPVVRTRKRRRE